MKTTAHKVKEKEYKKIDIDNIELYTKIKNSKTIALLSNRYISKEIIPITEFKSSSLDDKKSKYFEFNIIKPSRYRINIPTKCKVIGNYLETENEKNIIYIIKNEVEEKKEIYIEKIINISENIIFNEVKKIDNKKTKIQYISITVEKEEIIIEPQSNIYNLYSKGLIDIITLCNYVIVEKNNEKSFENIKNDIKIKKRKL